MRSQGGGDYILVCEAGGPDPDSVQTLLALAALHLRRHLVLRGVVCTGGGQAAERAALARCALDLVGVGDVVPVAVGSNGTKQVAHAGQFELAGFGTIARERLGVAADLIKSLLASAKPKSLTILNLGSLTDVASALEHHAELARAKLRKVAVAGGLVQSDGSPTGWAPDDAYSNLLDPVAAAAVYEFCLRHALPLCVVGRNAVPLVPTGVAHEFAARTHCPLATYVSNAQPLGLEALWRLLCAQEHGGEEGAVLPPRCDKSWFVRTFCVVQTGLDEEQMALLASRLIAHVTSNPIRPHLSALLRPYGVVLLMATLPRYDALFSASAASWRAALTGDSDARDVSGSNLRHAVRVPRAVHRLLLRAEDGPNVMHVVKLLRCTWHAVGAATGCALQDAAYAAARLESGSRGQGSASALPGSRRAGTTARVSPEDERQSAPRRSLSGMAGWRLSTPASPRAARLARLREGREPHSPEAIAAIFEVARQEARRLFQRVTVCALALGILFFAVGSGGAVAGSAATSLANSGRPLASGVYTVAERSFETQLVVRQSAFILVSQVSIPLTLLAFHPKHSYDWGLRLFAVIFALVLLYSVFFHATNFGAILNGSSPRGSCIAFGGSRALAQLVAVASLVGALANAGAAIFLIFRVCWANEAQMVHTSWFAGGLSTVASALYYAARTAHCGSAGYYRILGAAGTVMHALVAANAVVIGAFLFWPRARQLGQATLANAACSHGKYAALTQLLAAPADDADAELRVPDSDGLAFTRLALDGVAGMRCVPLDQHVLDALKFRRLDVDALINDAAAAAMVAESLLQPRPLFALHYPSDAARRAALGRIEPPSENAGCAAHAKARAQRSDMEAAVPREMSASTVHSMPRHSTGCVSTIDSSARTHASLRTEGSAATLATAGTPGSQAGSEGVPPPFDAVGFVADFYVVHAWDDPPGVKRAALQRFAEEWEEEHGRPPHVWLDTLCSDPSLTPEERLARMPVNIARSRQVLLLCGPSVAHRLWCIAELYCWMATGGSSNDIVVVPIGATRGQINSVIASFETFHVMHCRASLHVHHAAMVRMIELATVSRFAELVDDLLPAVRNACASDDAMI